jgi:hypothetical protein
MLKKHCNSCGKQIKENLKDDWSITTQEIRMYKYRDFDISHFCNLSCFTKYYLKCSKRK